MARSLSDGGRMMYVEVARRSSSFSIVGRVRSVALSLLALEAESSDWVRAR